jgi:hypothetical protein
MTDSIVVLLAGGREDLPQAHRIRTVATLEERVAVEFAGGYEHFAHHGKYAKVGGRELAVLDWTYRTKIAE